MDLSGLLPTAAHVAAVVSGAAAVLQARDLAFVKPELPDDEEEAKRLVEKAREEAERALAADIAKGERQLGEAMLSGLERHLRRVAEWSSEIRVEPASKPRTLNDLFVHLDLECESRSGRARRVTTADLARRTDSIVLLGLAGGGKTTAARYFASEMLSSRSERTPLLLELRDLRDGQGVMSVCRDVIGPPRSVPGFAPISQAQVDQFVLRALEGLQATLILDGLDEVTPRDRQGDLLREIAHLIQTSDVSIVLTCRKAEYRYVLPKAEVFELLPLTANQRTQLTERWIPDPEDRAEFLRQLDGNPIAGSEMLPLNLAVLILVYLRSGSTRRRLPDQPSTLYRKLLNLFLSEWDESRGVHRQSGYAAFTKEKKGDFLQSLAYELTVAGHRGTFTHANLRTAYARVYERFGLPHPREGAEAVAREVESHTGIVVERGPDTYSFFHLTFQEFLTAQYMIFQGGPHTLRLPWHRCPNEAAVAVAAANEPAVFLAQLANALAADPPSDEDLLDALHVFLQRLLTERPALEAGPVLGFAGIRLAALITAADGGEDRDATSREAVTESMADVLAIETLRRSLEQITASYLEYHPPTSNADVMAFRQKANQRGLFIDENWSRARRFCPLPDALMVRSSMWPAMAQQFDLPL